MMPDALWQTTTRRAMQAFHYTNGTLNAESVPLSHIAKQFGTPCYVYSAAAIEHNWQAFQEAFGDYPHRICYAVKANSNLAILNLLAKKNSGFDIVSGGELERVLKAGGDPQKIIFSGVGKTTQEILRALEVNIFSFDIESEAELERINHLATQNNQIANIALRINPNIDARTHPYISTGLNENKFGIDINEAFALFQKIKKMPHLHLTGIACHIGSQLTELSPFIEALDSLLILIKKLADDGISIEHINFGGGLGVRYQDESPPSIKEYVHTLIEKISPFKLEIIIEPGRSIIANAGILLTRVEYLKPTQHKNFAIIDAGMNDLMRPALYDAWQNILPVQINHHVPQRNYDVVGPVCESADFLGKNRELAIQAGDLLAIHSAGAYGFSMSSNYNSRPRPAEVMVKGKNAYLIRERETIDNLFSDEKIIP